MENNNNNNSKPSGTSLPMTKREEREEKMLSLARAGLSSYLCRLCTLRVHLSVLGVVSTPPQYVHEVPTDEVPIHEMPVYAASVHLSTRYPFIRYLSVKYLSMRYLSMTCYQMLGWMEELAYPLKLWRRELFEYMKVCQGVAGRQGPSHPRHHPNW